MKTNKFFTVLTALVLLGVSIKAIGQENDLLDTYLKKSTMQVAAETTSPWLSNSYGIYTFQHVGIGDYATSNYGLNMGTSIDMNDNDVNYVDQLHFGANLRFYDASDDRYLNYKWGNSASGGIRFRDGEDKQQGYIYADGNNTNPSFGLLDGDGNWALKIRKDDYISFLVNNSQKAIIKSDGNMAIGLTSPIANTKLTVNSVVNVDYDNPATGIDVYLENTYYHGGGVTGIKSVVKNNKSVGSYNYAGYFLNEGTTEGGTGSSYGIYVKCTAGYSAYAIKAVGNVVIDGALDCEEIDVRAVSSDLIKTDELNVRVDKVADYVFNDDYNLLPLFKVEQYVNENKHLPEIPKGSELEENGMDMSVMTNLLLQKIEELTLYTIQQQKEIEELKKRLDQNCEQ